MDRFKNQDEALRFWRWQKGYAQDVFTNEDEALEFFRWTDAPASKESPAVISVTSSPLETTSTSATPSFSQIKSLPTLPSIQSIASSSFNSSNLSLRTPKSQRDSGLSNASAVIPHFNVTTQAVSQHGKASAITGHAAARFGESSASVGQHFMNAMLESRSHADKRKGKSSRERSLRRGKVIKFGTDKRVLYLPSQFLTSSDIVINKRVAELLCSMCEQRQYVAYPSISEGAPPMEIQTEIVNAFLAKNPPIDLRKYFFTWCSVDVYSHRLKPQLNSASADGNALSSWYLRGSQAYIVPSSDVVLDESFESEFLSQFYSKQLSKRARNWPDTSDDELDVEEDHAECPKCQRKMTATELIGHQSLCSGRAPRIARRQGTTSPPPAKGKTTGAKARRKPPVKKSSVPMKDVSLSPDSATDIQHIEGIAVNPGPPQEAWADRASPPTAEGNSSSPMPAPVLSSETFVDSYDDSWRLRLAYPSPPLFGQSPPETPLPSLPQPVLSLLPEDIFDMTRYGTVSPPSRVPEASSVVRERVPVAHAIDSDWANTSPPVRQVPSSVVQDAPPQPSLDTNEVASNTEATHESAEPAALLPPISTPLAVHRAQGAASAEQRQILRLQDDVPQRKARAHHPGGRPPSSRPRTRSTRTMDQGGETGPARIPGPVSSAGRRTTKLA